MSNRVLPAAPIRPGSAADGMGGDAQRFGPTGNGTLHVSPYDLLGVTPSATDQELERRYRTLLRVWHPDLHQVDGPEAVAEAEEQTRMLTLAMNQIRMSRAAAAAGLGGVDDLWSTDPSAGNSRAPQSASCPLCGRPFHTLVAFEEHLVGDHRLHNLRRSRPPGRSPLGALVRGLRLIPLWMGAIAVLLVFVAAGPAWILVPMAFVCVQMWADLSPLYRTRPR